MARQDQLVVAIGAKFFGVVDDGAVRLLPPPLLQRSFSRGCDVEDGLVVAVLLRERKKVLDGKRRGVNELVCL